MALLSESKVAIVGGGVAGCSLAYHLAKAGWNDVVLLEADELASGSTWHAAGLCTQFNSSLNLMRLLAYSLELYERLGQETGQAVDLHRCGSVRLAATPDRLDEFALRVGMADVLGIPFELVDTDRLAQLHPLVDTDGLLGAAHLPTDGHVDPTSVTQALVIGSKVEILRRTPVLAMERVGGAWRLETPHGEVRAGIVVNAAGQWAPAVGRLAGVELPIVPLEHQYVLMDEVRELDGLEVELPVLRDPDQSYYVRQEGRSLLVGPFERNPKPWSVDGVPEDFHGRLLPPDLGQIEDVLVATADRIPALAQAGIRKVINGPDGYTPDGRCLMGPVPGVADYHVLAGFSIFGIVFAGGAGRYAAEWIVDGGPSDDMWELDVRRFGEYACSRPYLVARARETYEREYAIHYPEEELPAGRPLKTTPLYARLGQRGAVFGARSGWERPLWFASEPGVRDEYSFRRGNWFEAVGDECRAVRSRVGVLDQSSFAKYEVSGAGARALLDCLCANALPPENGRIVLTQMCRPDGGIECDVTVTQLADDRFYVVSAAAAETHDHAWIEAHLPGDGSVVLENVTARHGVLTVAGPRSRDLLEAVCDADLAAVVLPFFRACRERVAGAPCLIMRLSYVGELGFELHHPIEYQGALYEALVAAGEPLGLVDFGYRALDSMRLEKGYRLWGADISAVYTPLEAGLDRFVRFDKGEFVGRDALLRQRAAGPPRLLASLAVEAADADAHGNEPVRDGDRIVGHVAAGGYGHVVGQSIALAYLPAALAERGTRLDVEILGERRPATVVDPALYDPANERLLA